MATVTHRITTPSTSNASSYASGSFTPAVDDLLCVLVTASGTVAGGSVSSSAGLTFTKVNSAVKATSADTLYLFVANSRIASASAQTVTFDCTGDAATGAIVTVASVSGLAKVGSSVVLKSGKQDNGAAAGTPSVALGSAALTGNALIGFVGNGSSPATLTPPTSWAEMFDSTGYATPTTGHEVASINSGFTGSTVSWGSTSATAFAAIVAELSTANDGAASGSMDFSGSSAATVAISAAGSGSLDLTASSTGTVASSGVSGSANGSLGFSGSANASVALAGASTGSLAFSGAAAATVAVTGAVSRTFGLSGSAAATVALSGAANGSLGLSGSASATVADAGAGTGSLSLSGTSSGAVAISGGASGAVAMSGSSTGSVGSIPITGDAASNLALSGSADAAVAISGGSTLSFSLGGQAIATVEISGGATGELGLAGSGVASSLVGVTGSATGTAGLDGSASGWVISNDQYPLRGHRCPRPLAGRSRTYPLRRVA